MKEKEGGKKKEKINKDGKEGNETKKRKNERILKREEIE